MCSVFCVLHDGIYFIEGGAVSNMPIETHDPSCMGWLALYRYCMVTVAAQANKQYYCTVPYRTVP